MRFNRKWAMPNKHTFDIKPIKKFIDGYHYEHLFSIDPFANKNRIATITNDIDPDMDADYCMDALDFLKTFDDESVDLVLYDPPYCYDKETEVLTKKGWKCFKDITLNDECATLNTKTNCLEYQKPTEIINQPYKGKMIQIDSQSINLLVTPNHRMWSKNKFYGNYDFCEAKDLLDKRVSWFQKTCEYEGCEVEYFKLPAVKLNKANRFGEKNKPEKLIKMDLWLKFFGLFLAEGCAHKISDTKHAYTISIAQKKEHIRDIIREILIEFPYNYREEKNSFRIQDKQLWTYLNSIGKTLNKYIPNEFKELSKRQLEILINHMIFGDGTNIRYPKLNKKVGKMYHYDAYNYNTSSIRLMNDFSEILIKIGKAVTIRENVKESNNINYRISILKSKNYRVYNKNIKEVDFDDRVYCASVPNTTLLVKRRGRVCWSGNSVRQVSECYKKVGRTVNMETTQASFWSKLKKEIKRIVKPNGIVLSFGWNSGGIGKTNGFLIEEILLVNHGGPHNDTICVAEKKLKLK